MIPSRSLALGIIGALWLGYWWPLLSGSALPYVRDLLVYALPMKHYLAERLAAGELPLWAPAFGSGMPYLADPANQTLYPPNLLYAIAPDAHRGLAWGMALHGLLAALAALGLARALGVGRAPALWAALVYAYSGYVLSVAENVNYVAGTVWLPVALACLVRIPGGGRAPWVAGAAVSLALLVLAGDVVSAAAAVGAGGALCVWPPPAAGSAPPLRERVALLVAAVGLGALMAAPQVLPALQLQGLSVRAAGVPAAEAALWSFPPQRLWELIHPYLFGSDYADRFARPALYPDQTRPWADSVYVGVVPLALAVVGALRGRLGALIAAMTLGALVLALGRHTPAFDLARELPFVGSQRYPEKLMLFATLGVAMLAGLGADAVPVRRWVRECNVTSRARLAWTATVLLALPLSTLWLCVDNAASTSPSALWSALLPGVHSSVQGSLVHAVATGGVLAIFPWTPTRWRERAFAAVLVLGLADLLWVHRHAVPVASPALLALDRAPAALDVIEAHAPPGPRPRIFYDARPGAPGSVAANGPGPVHLGTGLAARDEGLRQGSAWLRRAQRAHAALERNIGVIHGLRYHNGEFSPLHVRAHSRFDHRVGVADGHLLMAMSGVGYVLTPISPHAIAWDGAGFEELARYPEANVRVLAVLAPRPRAYLTLAVAPWDGQRGFEQLARPGVASGELTLIGRPGAGAGPPVDIPPDGSPGTLAVVDDRPERLTLEVDAVRPTHLVVTESLLPGWQARVDGALAPLTLANGRFMAVPVPAGAHTVVLSYAVPGLGRGLVGCALGVLLCAVLLVRRRPPPPASLDPAPHDPAG